MTPIVTEQPQQVASILQRSVAMVLTCGYLGNHRRIELRTVKMEKDGTELNGEKDEASANFRLFAPSDIRACEKTIGALKQQLGAMSVDGGTRIFGDGTYLIPTLGVKAADEACSKAAAQLAIHADAMAAKLPEIKERRKAKLGALYREEVYPTADDVRAAYKIRWNYVSFGAPDQLLEVDAAVAAKAEQEWNARLSDAYADVVTGLRSSAALVMKELADRLRPNAEGEAKALRPTALRDLQDLLERLPILNSVGQDEHLTDALARIGALSTGIDVDTLRKAPAIRAMLLETAEQTAKTLDALVSSGVRAMTFEED
jgi:hypothetical protein